MPACRHRELFALAGRLRDEGKSEATIQSYLAHLRAALGWAAEVGMLDAVPKFPRVRRAKGSKLMKGRPVQPEEFHKMLLVVPEVVGEAAAPSWRRLLRGLWWSGLPLGEALNLYWDRPDKLGIVDLDGRRPMLRRRPTPAGRPGKRKMATRVATPGRKW